MKQSLQLRLGQHLAMTPQLQQAIKLLQLSTLELQTEVQDALESNLMLEVADDDHNRDRDGEHAADSDRIDVGERADDRGDTSADSTAEHEDAGAGTVETLEPENIPTELAVDSAWDDVYDSSVTPHGASDFNGFEVDAQRSAAQTLKDQVTEQLNLLRLSDTDRVIGSAIVDSLGDDGYLSCSDEDILQSVASDEYDLTLSEVQAVLRQMQNFDPPGVAARNLRECLLIQLNQMSKTTPYWRQARDLVAKHLDLLAGRDHAHLMRALKLDREQLQKTVELIQTLDPRPGDAVDSSPPEYVVPDVFVKKVKGSWQVELNADAFPRLRVNPQYASLIRRADNSADNSTLKSHLQEARWFIKSLRSRSETLFKVAACIVERQQAFLEHGEEAMKPMVLQDVAKIVGMHESTISRVTTQKYMHTPRGIYELKFFFSSHVFMKSGAECSSTAIRALLKKMIAAENPQKPLSDSKLAAILSEQGITVARRTVAKYREAMAIPSSSDRKSLV